MRYFVKKILVLMLFFSIEACSNISLHENFMRHMQSNIGKTYQGPGAHWMGEDRYLDAKTLPNGNLEHMFNFKKSCNYFFEVDKLSNVVVSWRFEGVNSDCQIPN
jgi:hypothetical protein